MSRIAFTLVSALVLAAAPVAGVAETAKVSVELPAPTGPAPVGTTQLHMIDHERQDPWHPDRVRELMVTITYPARHAAAFPRAEWVSRPVAAAIDQQVSGELGVPANSVDWASTLRHARRDAPVARQAGGLPVLLFSPGLQAPREMYAVLIDDLASRGYVVVSMSHTYETTAVRFPGGRVEHAVPITGTPEEMKRAIDARVADTRFVLDQLERRNASKWLDLSRVGMFGHSYGGYTSGETMVHDNRIDAGANVDGAMSHSSQPYLPGAVVAGLDRPFLLFGSANHDHRPGGFDRSWVDFWPNQRGYKRDLNMHAGGHYSFSDLQAALPQLGSLIDPAALAAAVGTVVPERSLAAQHAYLAAYFDLHLRGRDNHLLDGPSPRFPEIVFVP